MFLESFRHLIEIEALKKENSKNSEEIIRENKRISDLEERRKKTQIQNENLKLEEKNLKLSEAQNQIEDLQIRFRKLTTQLSLAVTEKEQIAFENQLNLTKNDIDSLENIYFEKLEQSENLLTQISENNDFFNGSQSTLEEIKEEVQAEVSRIEKLIYHRDQRIASLFDLCHPSMKSLYQEIDKRLKPKSPVSFLIEKRCTACHVSVDAVLKQSLEDGRVLECCPNCSRLLIPESARI